MIMYVMLLVVEQPKHIQHAGIKEGKADKCLLNVSENCVFDRHLTKVNCALY